MDDSKEQQWYVAVLIVRARLEGEWHDEYLVERQIRLIHAPDPNAAYERALALGAAEEHSYRNAEDTRVNWEFCGLADLEVVEASALGDGVEVYSWQSRGQPEDAVLPKDRLAVFWRAANGDRTAEDLLS